MLARLIAFAMLAALTAPASASAGVKQVSPKLAACHDHATQRYIADFRQVGPARKRHDEVPTVVTTFQNDNPRYEHYVAECMKRLHLKKTR